MESLPSELVDAILKVTGAGDQERMLTLTCLSASSKSLRELCKTTRLDRRRLELIKRERLSLIPYRLRWGSIVEEGQDNINVDSALYRAAMFSSPNEPYFFTIGLHCRPLLQNSFKNINHHYYREGDDYGCIFLGRLWHSDASYIDCDDSYDSNARVAFHLTDKNIEVYLGAADRASALEFINANKHHAEHAHGSMFLAEFSLSELYYGESEDDESEEA